MLTTSILIIFLLYPYTCKRTMVVKLRMYCLSLMHVGRTFINIVGRLKRYSATLFFYDEIFEVPIFDLKIIITFAIFRLKSSIILFKIYRVVNFTPIPLEFDEL